MTVRDLIFFINFKNIKPDYVLLELVDVVDVILNNFWTILPLNLLIVTFHLLFCWVCAHATLNRCLF